MQGTRSGLKTSEAARMLNVGANTVRAWERRAGIELCTRMPGCHRVYARPVILAMKDAQDDGFTGADIVRRAAELVQTGRYTEPAPLRERMFALEKKMDMLIVLIRDAHDDRARSEPRDRRR